MDITVPGTETTPPAPESIDTFSFWRELVADKVALISCLFILLVVLASIFAPLALIVHES